MDLAPTTATMYCFEMDLPSLPSCCPVCGDDLRRLEPDAHLCPKCCQPVRSPRSFWRDGKVHFGWVVAGSVLPLVVAVLYVLFVPPPTSRVLAVVRGLAGMAIIGLVVMSPHCSVLRGIADWGSKHHGFRRWLTAIVLAIGADVVAMVLLYVHFR